jgi:2'-5' RNA ligase
MSPLPVRMADRWQGRPEPGPGEAQLYWHILMRDQPQVRALAAVARQRLAGCDGLHFTPEPWLHLSLLRVGLTSDLPPARVDDMVGQARHLLAPVPPATCTIGHVRYHPEAITLGVSPGHALDAIAAAIRQAAASLPGPPPDVTASTWTPHVTVAYSTLDQPAAPLISALGRELPGCPVTIDTVHLIAQHGAERSWTWQPLAAITLSSSRTGAAGEASSPAS